MYPYVIVSVLCGQHKNLLTNVSCPRIVSSTTVELDDLDLVWFPPLWSVTWLSEHSREILCLVQSNSNKKKSSRRCGKCEACHRTEDCSLCDFCKVSGSRGSRLQPV